MTTVTRVGRAARAESAPTPGAARANRRPRPRQPYFALNGALMAAVAAVALSAIGLLYLIQTSQVAQLGYDLAHLQSRHDELELDNSRLGYELARYESLDTVAKVATEKLGMTPLARYQFLQVQLPAEQNLPPVAPLRAAPESLAHRLLRAVLGTGRATAPASGEPALSGVGGGSR